MWYGNIIILVSGVLDFFFGLVSPYIPERLTVLTLVPAEADRASHTDAALPTPAQWMSSLGAERRGSIKGSPARAPPTHVSLPTFKQSDAARQG